MHRSEFLKELKELFPELKDEVNKQEGLLHFEMTVFRRFAQRAIYEGEQGKLDKCFQLATKAFENGNSDLRDAIDVSFVEELDFDGPTKNSNRWAWNQMPRVLKKMYISFHGDVNI